MFLTGYELSTKSVTRGARSSEASLIYQLEASTALPPQQVTLTNTRNKKQLIDIICMQLAHDKTFHREHTQDHKLIITGTENVPT